MQTDALERIKYVWIGLDLPEKDISSFLDFFKQNGFDDIRIEKTIVTKKGLGDKGGRKDVILSIPHDKFYNFNIWRLSLKQIYLSNKYVEEFDKIIPVGQKKFLQ